MYTLVMYSRNSLTPYSNRKIVCAVRQEVHSPVKFELQVSICTVPRGSILRAQMVHYESSEGQFS